MTLAGGRLMLTAAQTLCVPRLDLARGSCEVHREMERCDRQGKLAQQRHTALRVGWNDAAWGQQRHETDADLARWYERGYTGGLIFRRKRSSDLAVPDIRTDEPRGLATS